MTGTVEDIPVLDATTPQAAGTPPYFGGFKPSWATDSGVIAESRPRLKLGTLEARSLRGQFKVPNNMLRFNAQAVDAVFRQMLADAVAYCEDLAFLTAAGGIQPLGITKSQALATTTARSGASAISYADTRLMTAKLLPGSRPRACWLVSQAAEDEILGMTATAESVFGKATTYLDPTTGRLRMFLGRNEVLATEKLPALNTLGDFILADLSLYVIGDLTSISVAASEHAAFEEDVTIYRLVHRVAGMPMLDGLITLADGSTTVSPFVALGTA